MTVPHPGVSEIGWLTDLKEVAENIGRQVFGFGIRWDVENLASGTSRRPDIIVRRDSNAEVLVSGEAKRPDTARGRHPLIDTEVRGAIEKALIVGSEICFNTNFFGIALLDARSIFYPTNIARLQGNLIDLISPDYATATNWWLNKDSTSRKDMVEAGLREFFEAVKSASGGVVERRVDEVALTTFWRSTERLVNPLHSAFIAMRNNGPISAEISSHAAAVGLRTGDDQEARYLVAQAVAEVLTAALFYQNIRDNFSLDPLLHGTDPRTSSALASCVRDAFGRAITRSGDYQTIFTLSPIALWILSGAGAILHEWKNLFGFIEHLDFTAVNSDVIGSIFERLISPERRHMMGQHYTSPRIAKSMCLWAVRSQEDYVSDVSCGAGTFLVETYKILTGFGLSHQEALQHTLGNDADPFAVHLATINLATRQIYRGENYPAVRRGDAFAIRPGGIVIQVQPANGSETVTLWPDAGLDAIVGNPPYDRKPGDIGSLRASLALLNCPAPTGTGMDNGNLAAWFVLLCRALLRPGGCLTLVLPTGVLQNDGLAQWRNWLRTTFDVVVWHTEDDVWFSEARVGVCVILAKLREPGATGNGALVFVDVRARADGSLRYIDNVPCPVDAVKVRDITTEDEDDILIAGTYPDVLKRFRDVAAVRCLPQLENVEVSYGNKLGHGAYELKDLAPDSQSVVRRVRGSGVDLSLSSRFLTPILVSPMDERTGEVTRTTNWVLSAPEALPSSGALRDYIRHCERLDVHLKPSVQGRGPNWWHVGWKRAQVAVQLHPGFTHQVWWSSQPFVAKNNFNQISFGDGLSQEDRELIAGSLASGYGALCSLYLSSEVGSEGVRYVSTGQLKRWPVLNPAAVPDTEKTCILEHYRRFRRREAVDIHLMTPDALAEWHRLTASVAAGAGLPNPETAAAEAISLAKRTCQRRAERERITLAERVRGGSSGTGSFKKHVTDAVRKAPQTEAVVDFLTGGSETITLREASAVLQTSLEYDDSASSISQDVERSLSSALGSGFNCAPVNNVEGARSVGTWMDTLVALLAGPEPVNNAPGYNAHLETKGTIRSIVKGWLRSEVNKKLN